MRHACANRRRAVYGRESANREIELVISWLAAFVVAGIVLAIMVGAMLIAGSKPAPARDLDGRYAQSELKPWFDALKNQNGNLCCSVADGLTIKDVDWDTRDGKYRVRLDGEWIVVPDEAVVTVPNRYGPAVVWPFKDPTDGHTRIRCFMPGAGA